MKEPYLNVQVTHKGNYIIAFQSNRPHELELVLLVAGLMYILPIRFFNTFNVVAHRDLFSIFFISIKVCNQQNSTNTLSNVRH